MAVFAGMEAIDVNDQSAINDDIDSLLMDTIIGEADLSQDASIIDEMFNADDKFNTSFEQLDALKDAIEEFGLSKGVIKAVDPDGYLAANGMVPAYEELNDLPTKDEHATYAIETITDSIKNAWKKIKEFMKKMWEKVKGFFSKAFQMFQNYDKILKNLKEKLSKKMEFDAEKAKDKKFKLVPHDELIAALNYITGKTKGLVGVLDKSLNNTVNDVKKGFGKELNFSVFYRDVKEKLKNENDPLKKYVGIEIEDKDDELVIKEKSDKTVYSDTKSETLKDHKYGSLNDVIQIIDLAISARQTQKIYEQELKTLDGVYKTFDKMADDVIKEAEESKKKHVQKNANAVRKGITSTTSFVRRLFGANMKAVKAAIAAGNAAVSVSK